MNLFLFWMSSYWIRIKNDQGARPFDHFLFTVTSFFKSCLSINPFLYKSLTYIISAKTVVNNAKQYNITSTLFQK